MLASAALVLLMVPGLAMFYAGMVRRKNIIATMMYSFGAMAVIGVQWVLVAVRESWNPAIRTMAVHGEFAGALQPLVIIARKAETKAAGILASAQIRPDRK